MACRSCTGKRPTLPFVQAGLPTIFAWGPFAGVEPLSIEEGVKAVQEALKGDE